MHHKIHIIQQHPLCLLVAFHVVHAHTLFFEARLDFIRNSLHLPRIGSAAHYKVVGKRPRPLFQLKNGDFLRLLSTQALMASVTWCFTSFLLMQRLAALRAGRAGAIVADQVTTRNTTIVVPFPHLNTKKSVYVSA